MTTCPSGATAARRDENTVQASESRPPGLSSNDGQLVTKHGVLDLERRDGRSPCELAQDPPGDCVGQEEEHPRMLRMKMTAGESDFPRPTGTKNDDTAFPKPCVAGSIPA